MGSGGLSVRGGNRIGSGIVALAGVLFIGAGESAADWKLYVQGGTGISTGIVENTGSVGAVATDVDGDDVDASPMLDGSFGLEVPMNELVPRELLLKVRLPDWPVRFEFEAAGLREWEFTTRTDSAGARRYFSEIRTTTLLFNQWVDIPVMSVYKPFQYLFGLGRQPNVRRWLEPASWYLGVGIGMTPSMEIHGSTNVFLGNDDVIDFAWNAGTGFGYQLTERVALSAGYRYLGLGKPEIDIDEGGFPAGPNDQVKYELQGHEFRVAVRVRVFEFASPWR